MENMKKLWSVLLLSALFGVTAINASAETSGSSSEDNVNAEEQKAAALAEHRKYCVNPTCFCCNNLESTVRDDEVTTSEDELLPKSATVAQRRAKLAAALKGQKPVGQHKGNGKRLRRLRKRVRTTSAATPVIDSNTSHGPPIQDSTVTKAAKVALPTATPITKTSASDASSANGNALATSSANSTTTSAPTPAATIVKTSLPAKILALFKNKYTLMAIVFVIVASKYEKFFSLIKFLTDKKK